METTTVISSTLVSDTDDIPPIAGSPAIGKPAGSMSQPSRCATAEVVTLVPRKRLPGRPTKPRLVPRRCQDSFDVVAAGVVGIVAQKGIWAAAKERVRQWADRDRAICSAAPKVLGYQLQHINRKRGFDWHSERTIAQALGISTRTVERAYRDLSLGGYILREPVVESGSKASKRWRTTLPALVAAGHEIRSERDDEGPDRKTPKDPTLNARKDPTFLSA
jgi:hypothetical protein